MKTQANAAPYLRLLIGGGAAILFATAGITAAQAWIAASSKAVVADELPAQGTGPEAHVSLKCAECGVVESTREIRQPGEGVDRGAAAGERPGSRYEVTVRMKDGASRVFLDANPANWRPGERVTLIQGTSQRD